MTALASASVSVEPVASRPAPEEPSTEAQRLTQVAELLYSEPYRTEFFQAVRLLERLEGERGPVGYFVAPDGEAVRFSSLPTLRIQNSKLQSLERYHDGQPRLVVQFMGSPACRRPIPNTCWACCATRTQPWPTSSTCSITA